MVPIDPRPIPGVMPLGPPIEWLDPQVIEIDTTVAPALAAAWGVFSLPTTFILDAVGQARHVNHGVVSAKKIQQQLSQKS